MGEPLEHLYFNWLCAKVVNPKERRPDRKYWKLLKLLHTTPFVWVVPGDDNRAEDGRDLRREFLLLGEIPDDPDWRTIYEASVLEVLVAFARRAEFQTEDRPAVWFAEFLDNLGFTPYTDAYNFDPLDVEDKLDVWIWRKYQSNGFGGLFPLRDPPEDQRKVDIWYQFCAYLVDQDRLP